MASIIEKLLVITLAIFVFGIFSIAIIFDDYDQFIAAVKENLTNGKR